MKLEYVAPKFLVKILEDPLFYKTFVSYFEGNEQFLYKIIKKEYSYLLVNLMKVVLEYLHLNGKFNAAKLIR